MKRVIMKKSVCIVQGNDMSEPNAGTNRVVAFICGLKAKGYNVQLVVPKFKAEPPQEIEGIHIFQIPLAVGGTLNKIPRALLLLKKAKEVAKKYGSIIHIQLSTLGGIAAMTGMSGYVLGMDDLAFDSPVYTTLPMSNIIVKIIFSLERMAVKRSARVIVVSNPLKEFLIKNWLIPKNKIDVIPNGFFKNKITKLLEVKNLEESNEIIFMGSLYRNLNVDYIISLAESLANKNINVVLIGDGVLRSKINEETLIRRLTNIKVTGWLPYESAMRLVMKSRIVFTAFHNSFKIEMSCPTKIIDYASLGKAMVLSDISEISKIFSQKKGAIIVNNKEDFVNNVLSLYEDEKLQKILGQNAKLIAEEYTWERQGEKLAQIYERLIL